LFWPFTVWINCSSDLKNFASSGPSALHFKWFSRSLEHFFHTVGWNNFGNKIPFLTSWLLGGFLGAVRILWLISLLIKPLLFCCCDYVKKCVFFSYVSVSMMVLGSFFLISYLYFPLSFFTYPCVVENPWMHKNIPIIFWQRLMIII